MAHIFDPILGVYQLDIATKRKGGKSHTYHVLFGRVGSAIQKDHRFYVAIFATIGL